MKKLMLLIFGIVVAMPVMAQDVAVEEVAIVDSAVAVVEEVVAVDSVVAELSAIADEAIATVEETVVEEEAPATGLKGIFVAPSFNYAVHTSAGIAGSGGIMAGLSVGLPVTFEIAGMHGHAAVDFGTTSLGNNVAGFYAMPGFLLKVAKLPFGCVVVDSKLGWAGEGFGAKLAANIVYPVAGMPLKIVATVGAGGGLTHEGGAYNYGVVGIGANYSLDSIFAK